jgi:two-component system, NtrC family, nitrogen regulation sensor histidine kinase GlnL
MAQMIERQLTHRAAARSVSGMAAMLAHEIKNPLSGIRGAAQLLEPALGAEDRALTHLICVETDRIRDLVDRMEVFGDERPLVKTPVNVHAVLDHVKRLAESGFARAISFVEAYDPSLPPIPADHDKLVQALLNLVKNAAEAITGSASKQQSITLRTAFRPGVRLALPGTQSRVSLPFMIEIEDTGAGIADHVKDHLFDPFVSTKSTGTGLGLALVAKIVADHGGIVECESQPQQTIFRILLPIAAAYEPTPSHAPPSRKAVS